MTERRLIGNILAEEGEADDEHIRNTITKRRILLNKEELTKIHRRRRSDPEIMTTSWPDEECDLFEEQKPSEKPKAPTEIKPSEPVVKFCKCEYSGKILEMAKEQNGSRLLQQRLEVYSNEEKQAVFEEILKNFRSLVGDVFGNFVIQKILDVGNKDQRKSIALNVYGKVTELSMNMYACRVIQKVLECCEIDQKRSIALEFKANTVECLENEFSNHVMQKCIEVLPFNHIVFIVDCVKARPLYWIDHVYGCRVVQKIIEKCPRDLCDTLIANVVINCVELSKKNYGNYVVQFIIEKGNESDKNEILHNFVGKMVELSKHKISRANPQQFEAFCGELFQKRVLEEVATDRFSNFVIQRALENARGPQQLELFAKINEISPKLKGYKYGKFVLNAVEKLKKKISI